MSRRPEDSEYRQIPWEALEGFANDWNKDVVVLLAYDDIGQMNDVVTWGRDISQAEYAADAGNRLKDLIGFEPELCKSVSAKVQEVMDRNEQVIQFCKEAINVPILREAYEGQIETLKTILKLAEGNGRL